jgi:hypothetical protein
MASIGPYANQTATAVFTQEELWLLQSSIRHEVPQHDQWHTPPGSPELNDQIVESILRCEELALCEAALILSWDDCLVIDYCVPQAAKSASGLPIGKSVLLKSYKARKQMREGLAPVAEEPGAPTSSEVRERLRNINGGN